MENDFFKNLIEQLDLPDNITMKTKLEDLEEWDSLSIVSFGAMVLTKYDVFLVAEDIFKAVIIEDLFQLISTK